MPVATLTFVYGAPVLKMTRQTVTRMLEAMKRAAPDARFYQASSSEQFGMVL